MIDRAKACTSHKPPLCDGGGGEGGVLAPRAAPAASVVLDPLLTPSPRLLPIQPPRQYLRHKC